jgi:hypothetical protein
MDKQAALSLAPLIVEHVKTAAQETLDGMNDDDRRTMHPQGLAALESLAGIQGKFCDIAPEIVKGIDQAGFFVKLFYGNLFAYLKGFQAIVKQMQAVLCPKAA